MTVAGGRGLGRAMPGVAVAVMPAANCCGGARREGLAVAGTIWWFGCGAVYLSGKLISFTYGYL